MYIITVTRYNISTHKKGISISQYIISIIIEYKLNKQNLSLYNIFLHLKPSEMTASTDPFAGLPQIPIATSVGCSCLLTLLYVGSVYVWRRKNKDYDCPMLMKQRIVSVSAIVLLVPLFIYGFSTPELLQRVPLQLLLGLRWPGLCLAVVIPYLLTVLLYLGPIYVNAQTKSWDLCLSFRNWLKSVNTMNGFCINMMAPLCEEFLFRGGIMTLMLQTFQPLRVVLITPFFFGIAHMHNILRELSRGEKLTSALRTGLIQFAYTTFFGFYSTYLFIRTGHLMAPLVAHVMCNYMGLPDLDELFQLKTWHRSVGITLYLVGLLGWISLLPIGTEPSLYHNELNWNV